MRTVAQLRVLEVVFALVGSSACGPSPAGVARDDAQEEHDPAADVFAACLDAQGKPELDVCEARDAGPSACLRSSVIAGGNVCTFTGCDDDDDCADLRVDDAIVECRDDVLPGARACVLACDELADCPAGMACGDGVCLWIPQR